MLRVSDFLSDQQITFEEMLHPPAYTAQRLAQFLRISGKRVVKSVLLHGPEGYFLAVLLASQRIDLSRLSVHFGGAVQLATKQELHAQFADCEWGSLIPFGQLYGLPTILEAAVPLDTVIVFEAQRRALAIRMTCRDFVSLEQPQRLSFAAQEN
jgi:Ala-tRNA(Pro) deacylase